MLQIPDSVAKSISHLPEVREFIDKLLVLVEVVEKQSQEIKELKEENRYLKSRLNLNSNNSSKPPSSDGLKKNNISLRKKSGKKPGGQKGHKGYYLKKSPIPDIIRRRSVDFCSNCGSFLANVSVSKQRSRQVFDIPEVKMEVTEYRCEEKTCPKCGHRNSSIFPEGVTKDAQYGKRLKAQVNYLSASQFIPFERLQDFYESVYNHHISQATFYNMIKEYGEKLASKEESLKETLKQEDILKCDETGVHVGGKLHYVHVICNEKLTFYFIHPKRGNKAMDGMGILPEYKGIVMHDHYASYNKYKNATHVFCNAHHLRELKAVEEQENVHWASKASELLLAIKASVDSQRKYRNSLSKKEMQEWKRKYQEIIENGLNEYKKTEDEKIKKRGRKKQLKGKNLLDRLSKYKEGSLMFMEDFDIPFDNNESERDIRMVKLKEKISGGFRSKKAGEYFCRIRGYISIVRKKRKNVLRALQDISNMKEPKLLF